MLDLNCFVELLDPQCGDRLFTMAIKQLCSQCRESLKTARPLIVDPELGMSRCHWVAPKLDISCKRYPDELS